MRSLPNLCRSCVRLHNTIESIGYNGSPTCNAFPGGIPNDIWFGGADHTTSRDGDNGVVFEMAPGADQFLSAYRAFMESVPSE